jgi:hypothetical protein
VRQGGGSMRPIVWGGCDMKNDRVKIETIPEQSKMIRSHASGRGKRIFFPAALFSVQKKCCSD